VVAADRAPRGERLARPGVAQSFDSRARLLETVVLVFDGGDEMVIHAMPARRKYLDLLPS